jgi:beta-glucoside operon transcriptional antiterminator
MEIKKILNNNVVLTVNEDNQEIVVMGKGIAFSKRVGNSIDINNIDKIFSLDSNEDVNSFAKLLSEVNLDYFDYIEKIVNYSKIKLGKKLSNSIYITLTDHFNSLIERAKVGAYLTNPMTWDIKRLYKDEFMLARKIVEHINEEFGFHYEDDEAANITLHLVNAELDTNFDTVLKITKVISEILDIVKYNFGITYNEESLYYYRFITHLRFFSQRIFNGGLYEGADDKDLFEIIKIKYPEEYKCILKISDFLNKEYNYEIEDEDLLYLTIHVVKLVKESK